MNDTFTRPTTRRRARTRFMMVAGVLAAVAAAATALPEAAGAATALPDAAEPATQICSNQAGATGDYYYMMWSDGQGSACITPYSGNSYSTSWSDVGDFVAGVGWNPGSDRTISYNSSLSSSGGTSMLSLYGWTTNPLVEYYIIEDHIGPLDNIGSLGYLDINMGTVTSDGGTYTIIKRQPIKQLPGSSTLNQYLAIRNSPRSSGTITLSTFFNAWASHGMNLGTMNYQILATEAWGGGSGSSSVTVNG